MRSQLAALYLQALQENASIDDNQAVADNMASQTDNNGNKSSRSNNNKKDGASTGAAAAVSTTTNNKAISFPLSNAADPQDQVKDKQQEVEENENPTPTSNVGVTVQVPLSEESPADLLRKLFPGDMLNPDYVWDSDDDGYDMFEDLHSEEHMEAYSHRAVQAIRNKDLDALYDMLEEGYSFEACNSNGEYLIHLACRRGDLETVQFMVEEARVPINVVDKQGRTILHDACWRPSRDPELLSYLLHHVDPHLLLAEDERGFMPFDYVRANDWRLWKLFHHTQLGVILERLNL